MAPRSAKKEKSIWCKCEQCKSLVLASELTKHQTDNCKDTGSANGYITRTGIFFSRQFECGSLQGFDDLKDVSERQLNGLILFSRFVMDKLNIVLGDLVEITVAYEHGDKNSFVRKVWPIEEKYGARVISSNKDEVVFPELPIASVELRCFENPVMDANKVVVSLNDEIVEEQVIKNQGSFLKLLQRQYSDRILNDQNLLRLKLCNRIITFKITKTELKTADLIDQMESLSVNSQYFHLKCNTTITIDSQEQTKNSSESPRFTISQIGGLQKEVDEILDIAKVALGLTKRTGYAPINRGILVYGVSGVGKTLLVNSVADYFKCQIVRINSAEVFSKFYGESENNILRLFNRAFTNYPDPTIVIVEEIQNICPKSEVSDIVKRISHFFVHLLDSLHTRTQGARTLVIATTDNPDSLNSALRRSGRMEYELEIPVPSAEAREQILLKILTNYKHDLIPSEVKKLARIAHGYVGADLVSLVGRTMYDTNTSINYAGLVSALQHVKPSAMREIMIECPNVHWADIGGQDDLKLKLRQIIEWPIHRPEIFTRLGIDPPRGLLMFGPPGCSKTMIAKAIATESKVNFLSIKGSELFSMWVGESERAVSELFRKARQVAPSIIFFDEIDAIGGERSAETSSSVNERVLAQILTEIDGVSELRDVKIVAATNRPDLIDKALMRPGRLDRIIYVGLPDARTRAEIFQIKLRNIPITEDVDLQMLVDKTDGYCGSEIEAVCQEAVLCALEDSFETVEISKKYFDKALLIVKPRTSKELLQLYDTYLKQHQS
ncbi:ATPase family gene 2 protein homolog A [Malaya genurostris]|uniref:ATPase family gene 2 protein homolog A n=1 Tax=Malaya genurostris TaxID=325434 RepID=UPI0026F38A42|nr:ATPase family gene 2 protein homolog A [Malaya genurostris]XP_058444469.1 ATPase family gene 2 protein homolog A [Malaya genurostris]